MSLTYSQAIDEISQIFYDAWRAGAPAIVGNIPEIRWHGVAEKEDTPVDDYWVRFSTRNVNEQQASLSNEVGAPGQRRYNTAGLVFVQLFCPMTDTQAKLKGELLAEIAKLAFRGKTTPGGVWFRNTRINNLPVDEKSYRFNIVSEYEYDEIG